MPRRRTTPIIESDEELAQLLHHHSGTVNAERIALLIELKRNPTAPMADCATAVGLSLRKAERLWKRYRDEGLWGVVEEKLRQVPRELHGGHLDLGVSTIDQPSSVELLCLAAGLQTSETQWQWVDALRRILKAVLPGLDHVAVMFNSPTGPIPQAKGNETATLRSYDRVGRELAVRRTKSKHIGVFWKYFLDAGRELNVDYSMYCQDVHGVDLAFRENESHTKARRLEIVGCLVFFVRSSFSKFPATLKSEIELHRPWLSRCMAHQSRKRPAQRLDFNDIETLASIAGDEHALTATEILVLRLLIEGASTKRISGTLNISCSTVSSHIQSIVKKFQVVDRKELPMLILREYSGYFKTT